jgi:hypothetical protein
MENILIYINLSAHVYYKEVALNNYIKSVKYLYNTGKYFNATCLSYDNNDIFLMYILQKGREIYKTSYGYGDFIINLNNLKYYI